MADKDIERDIKLIGKVADELAGHLKNAVDSEKKLHGLLERMAERYQDELGVDIRSVIPKDPGD